MDWGLTPNNACWSNWLAVHRRSLPHRLGFVAGGFTFLYRVEGWRIYSSFCLKLTFSFWGETPSFQGELAVSFRECSKSEVSTVNTFILLLVVMMHHALRRKFHVWITCFFLFINNWCCCDRNDLLTVRQGLFFWILASGFFHIPLLLGLQIMIFFSFQPFLVILLLMEEILHHLGWLFNPINNGIIRNHHPWWCRILSINSMICDTGSIHRTPCI